MLFRPPSYPRKDCSLCKTFRLVISMAVLILAIASLTFDFGLLKDINFSDLFALLIGIGLLLTVSWKVWQEYFRKK